MARMWQVSWAERAFEGIHYPVSGDHAMVNKAVWQICAVVHRDGRLFARLMPVDPHDIPPNQRVQELPVPGEVIT